jgi:hypothetical protein
LSIINEEYRKFIETIKTIGIVVFLFLIAFCVHQKIGLKKFGIGMFYVFSGHWMCKLIIRIRGTGLSLNSEVENIINNDPEMVKTIIEYAPE